MNDTESKDLIDEEKIAHIRRILDHPIETDDDYAELAKLVDDENDD